MGTFILIIIFVFVIWPIIRVAWAVHKLRSNARKAYEQMYQQASQQQGGKQQRKGGWSVPNADSDKKIKREDGEYVSFEEISSPEPQKPVQSTSYKSSVKTEQQIEDADWEEL